MTTYLWFSLIVLLSGILIKSFYDAQRRLFVRTYYSLQELITGMPSGLSINQIFFVRFLPPFLLCFALYKLFNPYLGINFLGYSLIGASAAALIIVPTLVKLHSNSELEAEEKILRKNITALITIYLMFSLLFMFISAAGAYLASLTGNIDMISFLPTRQGIVDGLWLAFMVALFSIINRPII